MKIPKKFKIHGQTIEVKFDDKLFSAQDVLGVALLRKNLIKIQDNNTGFKRPKTQIEQTFLHELVHMILEANHYRELNDDEKFVEQFSTCLHQVLTTMEY